MLPSEPLKLTAKVCVWNLLAISSTFAQDQDANRASPALPSRAAEIESLRARKAAGLQPDRQQGIERILQKIEDDRVLQRIFGGVEDVRLRVGGLITNSGLALGPEDSRLAWHDALRLRASVRGSLMEFYLMEVEGDIPALAGGLAFVNLCAPRQDYPRVDYYGPGPHSHKSGDGRLKFDDLAARYGFQTARLYSIQWDRFDNQTGAAAPIAGATGSAVPRDAGYLRASIVADDPARRVTVYLRGSQVVGIERSW